MANGIPLDEIVYFDAITSDPTTGGATDADSPPTFDVFEEATDTAILDDQVMTKRTSLTGNYRGTFTASIANGFEVGKWYSVIASGTVSGTTGKAVLRSFRVTAAENVAGVPVIDVGYWRGSQPTVLTSSRVDVSVGSMATDVITSTALAADAVAEIQSGLSTLTAGAVNAECADALADVGLTTTVTARLDVTVSSRLATASYTTPPTAAVVASQVRTELTTELARIDVATSTRGTSTVTTAQVNAEVLDVLSVDTFAEPTGAPAATDDLATKLGFLYEVLRNKITVTASAATYFNDAGTAQWSKSLSDDGTVYLESEGA